MKLLRTCVVAGSISLLAGCATGLNSIQKQEYAQMEADGVLVKEKNPTTGAVLGLLPGGGSFYAGEVGLGVVNLLLWPASILWDPVSGYDGAQFDNYYVTKSQLKKQKAAELSDLDYQLSIEQISEKDYAYKKRKLEEKYSY